MRRVEDLDRDELAKIVNEIRDCLWLTYDHALGFVFNHDKEWDADTIEAISGVLTDRDLGPPEPDGGR